MPASSTRNRWRRSIRKEKLFRSNHLDLFGGACPICGNETHAANCGRRFLETRTIDGRPGKLMLYEIRHGETDEDKGENPKFSGPGEIPLNAKGKRQAELVGEFLKSKNLAYLLTSPIPRAFETANIIGKIVGLEPKVFEDGKDWPIGLAAGRAVKDVLPFVVFFERNPDLVIPGGASYASWWDAAARGQDFLFDQPFEDMNIGLVTHSRYIAISKMRIDGKGMEPTDFLGSPKPGGAVAISRDENRKLTLELAFGEWNGDTR